MKHRLTFTTEELQALEKRLVPLNPSEYDLHTFALLRGIYGRIIHVQRYDDLREALIEH